MKQPSTFKFFKMTACNHFLFVLLALFCFGNSQLKAQDVQATISADTNAILIGNQFRMTLELKHPANVTAQWPNIPDTFSLMEVVQRSPIDTIQGASGNSITNSQHFVITSFDSGYHVIPPFTFNYKLSGDTTTYSSETEPLLITVTSIPVDTTRAIKDLKGQVHISFSWVELLPYLGILLLAVLAGFLVYRYLENRKRKVVAPVIAEVKRPAHEIALEALKELDERKLWQQGNYKAYYTGLSDITRTFIENRWSVAAMEMTTDEILHLTIIANQIPDNFTQVKYLLELADLVKFAKVIPIANDNEQSMRAAIAFVNGNISGNLKPEDAS